MLILLSAYYYTALQKNVLLPSLFNLFYKIIKSYLLLLRLARERNIYQLLDEVGQNIAFCQWRADQLFVEAERNSWTTLRMSRPLFVGNFLQVTWLALG